MARCCADHLPAGGCHARAPAQGCGTPVERPQDGRHHPDLCGAGPLAGRTADRLHLDRQLAAGGGIPRSLPRRRDQRQAHQTAHQQHTQPRVRGAAVRLLAECLLSRWPASGLHGVHEGKRRPLHRRREIAGYRAAARHGTLADGGSDVVAGWQAHRVQWSRARLQQPVHDRRRRPQPPPADERPRERIDAELVTGRKHDCFRQRPWPGHQPRTPQVRQVEDQPA